MSNVGRISFPIRFGDVIFADAVLDPNGRNPKTRRVVVLTPDAELASGFPIVAAAITGSIPTPLTADYVLLPYKNPPGSRHPRTGLTKRAAVLCTWIIKITSEDVAGRSGFVPPALMTIDASKTSTRAKALGGWN